MKKKGFSLMLAASLALMLPNIWAFAAQQNAGLSSTGTVGDAFEIQGEEGNKSLALPDCPDVENTPFLHVRNMIPGTSIVKIRVKRLSDLQKTSGKLKEGVDVFKLFSSDLLKDDNPIAGVSLKAVMNPTREEFVRCGRDMNLTKIKEGWAFWEGPKSMGCDRKNKLNNLYEIGVELQANDTKEKYMVVVNRNVCDESSLDLLPKLPPNNMGKNYATSAMSMHDPDENVQKGMKKDENGIQKVRLLECPDLSGVTEVYVRNTIPGTKITRIRVLPFSEYNPLTDSFKGFESSGVDILAPNETIPAISYRELYTDAHGKACGTKVNFNDTGLKETCDQNSMQAMYLMHFTLEDKQGRKWAVEFTRNICDESLIDLAPGISAKPETDFSARRVIDQEVEFGRKEPANRTSGEPSKAGPSANKDVDISF